ncbi:hypothetical protein Ais01nite_36340 [Asanoa ishikariensis]|uniref:WD40-like Beta Propeller Repeat n=1 Tax=Asanoa ishikariensis TaxID=137265 RepID=A0A1H3LQG7_9ACTN|nr:hypothetical protein [Asanoa ishikariensis]GIF65599.1 hypothetical protein Ais01nite_36340 [Asanoa ishikariensis]SDY66095.1 hypothetical protein SAMN05421684_0873 [Asanoa ishikariensis]
MRDFNDDDARLSELFNEFRDEVAPYVTPPGTAAARHWLRRRRRAGAAAIATCAVLFVGGPVGFVAANHDTPTPPPIGPTLLPTPRPTTPAPTPTVTTPAPSTSPPSTEPGLPKVPGKVFYLDQRGRLYLDGRQYPGGDVLNVNVSPDGKRVTWVENGTLMMSDLDGGDRRTVYPDVENMCTEPIWSADGELLLFNPLPKDYGLVTLPSTEGVTEIFDEVDGCHVRWSADRKRIAFQHGDIRGVTVQDLSGGNKVTLDRDDVGGRFYVGLNGISADGDRICAWLAGPDTTGGDAARDLGCNTIIDVSAKKVVDMPFEGELTNAIFLADGGMLARVETDKGSELLLLDADDRVIARSVESTANAKRRLLSYTP